MKLVILQFEEFLAPTRFIDFKKPIIAHAVHDIIGRDQQEEPRNKAIKLFKFVRDRIKYKINRDFFTRKTLKSSYTLEKKEAWCVPKAILLCSFARAVKIPSRLHFATIINHRISESLREYMGTNIFVYHGYAELYIDNTWLKVNPAFDATLSREKGFPIVEFDGKNDALFKTKDVYGNPFIEYIEDLGVYSDLPYTKITTKFMEFYGPHLSGRSN